MKKLLTVCFLLFSSLASFATHIVAYDGYATCVAETQDALCLEVNILLYRDATTGFPTADTLQVGVYPAEPNASLLRVFKIGLLKKTSFTQEQAGLPLMWMDEYADTVWLPKNSSGYTLSHRQCCFYTLTNIQDEQGFDLRIETPAEMVPGDKTPSLTSLPFIQVQRGKFYSFPHHIQSTLYDSVVMTHEIFHKGGESGDPQPNPAAILPVPAALTYRTNYSKQYPLRTTNVCDFTSDPDSHFIEIQEKGKFLLPFTALCYKNGVQRVYSRVLLVIAVDTVFDHLNLCLGSSADSNAVFYANSVVWQGQYPLVLERSLTDDFNSPTIVGAALPYGFHKPITDPAFYWGTRYYYRLKLQSLPVMYSNVIELYRTTTALPPPPDSSGVGFSETERAKPLIYPNPADRMLYLQLHETAAFELYSCKGELLRKGALEEGTNTIALDGISKGIYLLRIGDHSQKLVIGH